MFRPFLLNYIRKQMPEPVVQTDNFVAFDSKTAGELGPHTGPVYSVDLIDLPGPGQRFASASADKTVRVWDAASGKCLKVLEGHTDIVRSVAHVDIPYPPTRLVSGSDDGTLRVWDVDTGECLHVLKGGGGKVNSVTLADVMDHIVLVSGTSESQVAVWRGRILAQSAGPGGDLPPRVMYGHSDEVLSVAYLGPDTVASGSVDTTVRVWDLSVGKRLKELQGHTDAVTSVFRVGSFGPLQELVSGSKDKTLRLWDIDGGYCLKVLKGHEGPVSDVISLQIHGTPYLVSASYDGTVRLWEYRSRECVRVLKRDVNNALFTIVSLGDGQLLCAGEGSDGANMWVWTIPTSKDDTPTSKDATPVPYSLAAVAGGYKTRRSRKKGKKSRKTRGRRRYYKM